MLFLKSKKIDMGSNKRAMRNLCALAGTLVLAAAGCRDTVGEVPMPKQFKGPAQHMITNDTKAGVEVPAGTVDLIHNQVVGLKVVARPDPFALQPVENEYDLKENNERIFATQGAFFDSLFTPRPVAVRIEQFEPQPFRRLAG